MAVPSARTDRRAERRFVLVVGDEAQLADAEGAAEILTQLGAQVRRLGLWEDPSLILDDDGLDEPRAIVIETPERPDIGALALRHLRKEPRLQATGALLAVSESHVQSLDHGAGFSDFVLSPYLPSELYARIRRLEWQTSEFSTEEHLKLGEIVVDKAAREVRLRGKTIDLTRKEFDLLVCLAEHRGKVRSREQLLLRVWGARYEGGPRTVDIHVTRLRAKLGSAIAIETLRGSGYKLASFDSHRKHR